MKRVLAACVMGMALLTGCNYDPGYYQDYDTYDSYHHVHHHHVYHHSVIHHVVHHHVVHHYTSRRRSR